MINILGKILGNAIALTVFIIPEGIISVFKEGLRMCAEVFHNLKSLLKSDGYATSVGDEGGFAPSFSKDEEALSYIVEAVKKSGYRSGEDFMIAIDAASSEWTSGESGEYVLPKANKNTFPTTIDRHKIIRLLFAE